LEGSVKRILFNQQLWTYLQKYFQNETVKTTEKQVLHIRYH